MHAIARALRLLALAWLIGVQPVDLALTASRMAFRPAPLAWPALLLVAARVATVALGVATGLALARRTGAARPLARLWLLAEAVTLGVAWGSDIWPSNRPPGGLLPLALVYVSGALVVAVATWRAPSDDLPTSSRSR